MPYYPGIFANCNEPPRGGGLPLPELRKFATSVGVRDAKSKKRPELCLDIAKETMSRPPGTFPKVPIRKPCEEKKDKKFLTWDKPPYVAKDCPNQVKRGNNGKMWRSREDARGYYSWTLVAEQTKSKYIAPKSSTPQKNKGGCQPKYTSSYTSRPSPPFLAKDCPGQLKFGNDGKKWISKQDVRGTYRWQPFDKNTKTTTIHTKPGVSNRTADREKMHRYCMLLERFEMKDLISPINRQKVEQIGKFTQDMVKKYKIDTSKLISGINPEAFRKNCEILRREI